MTSKIYTLGHRSCSHLITCDQRLVTIIQTAIKITPIDFTIIEGFRSDADQLKAFEQGRSHIDGISKKGMHNYRPSLAFDAAPYPINWNNKARFYMLAGVILAVASTLHIPLRWGGDWNMNGIFTDQTLHDLPHFELV